MKRARVEINSNESKPKPMTDCQNKGCKNKFPVSNRGGHARKYCSPMCKWEDWISKNPRDTKPQS